jgi:hypothetical protein
MWVTPDAPSIDPETGAGQMNGTEFLFSAPQVVRTYLAAQGVKSVLVIPLCSKGQVNRSSRWAKKSWTRSCASGEA